jgi:hypothetical protein
MENKKPNPKSVPPRKCAVCGLHEIAYDFDICPICGWQDDLLQNVEPDFTGGANELSLHQYKETWKKTK